ncbi:unnamed protein product [marine sediment metagenome]|uniref:Uncharacterized protein n=1 Tax=marine sediment metagenome TaxID=412755 RepID=X1MKP8_9ZZZZ
MQKEKRLNVYIPVEVDRQLRLLDGTIKSNVCSILTQGLHKNTQGIHKGANDYDQDLIKFFQQQVKDLQTKNEKLENKCEFYSVNSMGYWKRRRYNKQMKLLPVASANPNIVDV